MNLVDLLVLVIIAVSALLGLSRGFVREMLGLGAWLLAAYGAYRLAPGLIPLAERSIGNPDVAGVSAYVVSFLGLLIILSLLANLVGRVVRLSALGGLDRTLGLVFGIARGALVLIAAYVLAGQIPPATWPPQLKHARTIPLLYEGAKWAVSMVPQPYQPKVLPPPDDNPLTSAALLHVTPDGTAIGPRPHQP